jgi:hypothetical protein
MARVEYISEAEAPAIPKTLSASAQETLRIITGLKSGTVAKVWPDEGQTLRGLKTSFSRVAKGQNVKLNVWSLPDDDYIYVKRAAK